MGELTALVLMSLALPAGLEAKEKPRPDERPNIVLISIDTLRADHLSCYGYPLRTSPQMDDLARQGALFQNAYSPIPLTGPAHISLLTSLYPQQHGATINGMRMSARPRPVTLAQVLRRLGYRTGAFVSAWPLKKGITGLGRGFGVYNEEFTYHYKLVNTARDAKDVTAAAIHWLKKRHKDAFFLWVHYFDPHEPYNLRPGFENLAPAEDSEGARASSAAAPDGKEDERVAAYNSEIAYTDHYVGEILQQLADLGVRERTLIVLTADHGESLGENGYWGHGDHLYQPIVRIPLIVSYPGFIRKGSVVRENVGLLDLMPSILDYAGISVPLPLEGKSFRSLLEGAAPPPERGRVYFLTYNEPPLLPPRWISWIWSWAKTKMSPSNLGFASRDLKVVRVEDEGQPRVYRLDANFRLEHPKSDIAASRLKEFAEQLDQWFKRTNRGLKPEGKLTQEDIEAMRSLGYIGP